MWADKTQEFNYILSFIYLKNSKIIWHYYRFARLNAIILFVNEKKKKKKKKGKYLTPLIWSHFKKHLCNRPMDYVNYISYRATRNDYFHLD